MNRTAPLAGSAVAVLFTLVAGVTAVSVTAVSVTAVSGCVPIARKAQCTAAEECDAALDVPFGDFGADDQTFGDLGTCWANEETAKACVAQCDRFVAEQRVLADDANNDVVIVACGGALE